MYTFLCKTYRRLTELEKEPKKEGDGNQEKTRLHALERLAEVRMTLGEVCALDDKFPEAITEFNEAQLLLGTCCPPDDRRLAETYRVFSKLILEIF